MSSSKTDFHSCLRCIECRTEYSLKQVLYRCSKEDCGGLLEVSHDIQAFQAYTAQEWKETMGRRWGNCSFPFSSGVWSKKEWVLPSIRDEHIVSLGEGKTPLIELCPLAEELGLAALWVKQCGISHTGSFKDLGMTVLVSYVQYLLSENVPIRAIACASTGDTSAALAAYAAYAGIPTIVLLPAGKITMAQLAQPIASGAHVFSLDTDFDGCMRIVKELTQDSTIYLANSLNPLRLEGQKSMGMEVLQQLDWQPPDWFIIPGGNLGNVSALASGMLLMQKLGLIQKLPRICVAQSQNANPLYLSFQDNFKKAYSIQVKTTLASAIQIGDPVSYPRAVRALEAVDGVVEQANEEELANAAARTDRYGLFNDPHTGVALACLEKLATRGEVEKTDRVVVVSTAHGLKFADSKTAYHQGKLSIHAKYANQPIELESSKEAVLKALDERKLSMKPPSRS